MRCRTVSLIGGVHPHDPCTKPGCDWVNPKLVSALEALLDDVLAGVEPDPQWWSEMAVTLEQAAETIRRMAPEKDGDEDWYEQAWNDAHADLLVLAEADRVKARELIAGIAGGDFNAADGLIGSLRRNGFEIVSATAMVATPEAAAAIAKRGNTTYRCQVQQAGSGTCTWPTCGCGDA